MRLIFVTQEVDPSSPVLGATVAKLRALAARVDELVVLADRAVPETLPENCRVHLFRSRWKGGRGLRFEAALARELRPRPAAVVAHMCPIYAVLAAPAARPLGIRVVLWFTHWKASRLLSLAERASTVVATVEVLSSIFAVTACYWAVWRTRGSRGSAPSPRPGMCIRSSSPWRTRTGS